MQTPRHTDTGTGGNASRLLELAAYRMQHTGHSDGAREPLVAQTHEKMADTMDKSIIGLVCWHAQPCH